MGDLRLIASIKMYAETSEKKMTRARIGFALLCGLAVCCSVMYITADAGDEYMHEVIKGKDAGTSVASTDVLKAGVIYTETPDGRMRLMDYYNRVEKSIASEVATRKADIASVRAEMQRDFRFNARARYKLHKAMLKQMARNAKIAKDNLNRAMRRTQEKFAKQASLANRRQRATNARNRKTLAIAAADRRENAKNLRLAVSAWQKQTAAWAAATNAKIDRANRHVAANAAAITENAKKATKDLNNAMNSWNHKIARFSAGEKAANSKLGRQFKAQDKATRAWATNKINAMVASTGAQFAKVETKMAKNRHEVDMALRQATMRFAASLNAQKALEDRRYAQTVRNIQAARAEAKAKVAKATTEFKMGLLNLGTTVRRQMIYAVKSMAKVAKDDLALAMKDSVKTMNAFQKKASAAHKKSAADRARIANTIKANAKDISRRIRDAVLFDARSQNALREETQKKIKNVHNRLDIFSLRMRQIAKANRAAVKAQMKATLTAISNEQRRARIALGKFSSADSKRQASSLAFLKKQLKKAAKEADDKFGKAYKQLAKDKAKFDRALGGATKKLNQALAKQAALADGRFSKTVKDLAAARKQATAQVKQLRQDFSVGLVAVTAESKRVNTRITGQISVVSGEVQTLKSNQITVNNRVKRELAEIRRVSNVRFSEAKRARGRLKALMDENKKAAAAEVKALEKGLNDKIADMQKYNAKTAKKLNAATTAAATASRNALKRAQKGFATKMAMLTSVIAANAKRAQRATQKLTGVASNINKANKAARKNIRAQTSAMQADMNNRIVSAITTGEALGKAIQQRLSSNLKSTVRSMRVELAEGLDRAADRVLRTVSGKRHKMADNYLSLKAYSVAAVDKVIDYTAKGKGRNSLAAVNGLVNEYAGSCKLVRARWPMGLGKYLMDKLEVSMLSKGVLQVDKISGKKGNYVYINGRSVGLSNKLNDFASLAAKMSVYEAVLAKLTAKLPTA